MAIQDRRAPLSERQVENMMTVFIRKGDALETAQHQLTPESFAPHHRNLAALWAVVCDHVTEHVDLPDEEAVCGELERRCAEDPEGLSDEEFANLDEYIRRAYAVSIENLSDAIVRVAFKYLKRYLEERIADKIRRDLTSSTYVPGNLCSQLEGYSAEISRIQSIAPRGLSKPFPSGWDQTAAAVRKSETGLKFLDTMLNGGQAAKEVYGILGPHGSCKTTIGIQYGTMQADRLRRQ